MSRVEIRSYTPYPKQRLFHESDAYLRAYLGGFGAGKTMAGCWEAIDVSLAYPGNLGIIARRTYRELEDSTKRTFFEVCPPELIRKISGRNESVTLINGSEILFRSLDQPDKLGRGINLGWFYVDEASEIDDEDFPKMLVGRLRRANIPWRGGWITSNPPAIEHWIHRWWVERPFDLPAKQNRYWMIKATSYENPNLPPEYIKALEEEYSPQWVRRYLLGEFGHITPGSPVYENFNERAHVTPNLDWLADRPIIRSWDFGWHHPAVLFSQTGPNRSWRIIQEKMGTKTLLRPFAEEIVEFSNAHYPGATFIDVGDPAGNQHGDKSDRTSVEILRDYHVTLVTRRYPKKKLIELVDQRLSIMRKDRDGNFFGSVQISKRGCPITVEGFAGGYSWPRTKEGHMMKETPYEDSWYEHLMDCAQYAAASIFYSNLLGSSLSKITSPRWDWAS